jgi:hypothetical protein
MARGKSGTPLNVRFGLRPQVSPTGHCWFLEGNAKQDRVDTAESSRGNIIGLVNALLGHRTAKASAILKSFAVTEVKRHGVNPSVSVQFCCAWVADFAGLCRNLPSYLVEVV